MQRVCICRGKYFKTKLAVLLINSITKVFPLLLELFADFGQSAEPCPRIFLQQCEVSLVLQARKPLRWQCCSILPMQKIFLTSAVCAYQKAGVFMMWLWQGYLTQWRMVLLPLSIFSCWSTVLFLSQCLLYWAVTSLMSGAQKCFILLVKG